MITNDEKKNGDRENDVLIDINKNVLSFNRTHEYIFSH